MKAKELIDALGKKLGTVTRTDLALMLGVSAQTLINWEKRSEDLSAAQIANALVKSRISAVDIAQYTTIKPIVEFFRIRRTKVAKGESFQVLANGAESSTYVKGLRSALEESHGIYVFYDSKGEALYVGKAREQSIWKEMNLAYNRPRELQKIVLVKHPNRNQEFRPGHEMLRQPRDCQLELFDIAGYFSAYQVADGMIDDLEALMVRAFANDLLNARMETFAHSRQ